jgi:hypothetical protein
VLFEWMGDHGVSRCRLADWLGVNEKQVRKMLKGETTIPSQVSSCIPCALRQDYLDRLAELDGGAPTGLQARIDRLSMDEAADVAVRANARVLFLAKSGR